MLGSRFDFDGHSHISLNIVQENTRNSIIKKIENKYYRFEKVPCCICGETKFESIAKKDRYGIYCPVVICKICGLIQSNPRMDQIAYTEFYQREYRPLYEGLEMGASSLFEKQIARAEGIFNYVFGRSKLEPECCDVLEIGCGSGGILHYFKLNGCRQVQGCDLNDNYINYGKDNYGLDLYAGDIDKIPIKKPPHIILYIHVLEHILYVNNELQKANSILDRKGIMYIQIPSVKNIHKTYQGDFLLLLQNAHTYHFSLRSLSNLLNKNGFALLSGNENVQSIFIKSDTKSDFISDYEGAISYLKRAEKYILYFKLYAKLRRILRKLIIGVLEILKVKKSLKRLLKT